MPKIDFYTLSQAGEEARLLFACRLTEKAFSLGHKIYLFAASEAQAVELDNLLWSFNPESFIPHALDGVIDDEDVPVIIGFEDSYTGPTDVLINLSPQIPACHDQFQRITEIVSTDDAVKQFSRQHWQHYKDQGYTLDLHKL